ncbi:MAG TPA: LysM peptidoglycan-binding domain-containing protein [Terrimicrobiaceae bacterium]
MPARFILILVLSCAIVPGAVAQTPPGTPAPARIEHGLENAVKWKWRVAPSDPKDWGLELPRLTRPSPVNAPAPALPQPDSQSSLYEVKRGDALILIGKRFGVTVAQIKELNGLKDDKIRIGQILRIPPAAPQTPPSQSPNTPSVTKEKQARSSKSSSETAAELENVRLQVFLDREQFSAGPITGKPGPAFRKVLFLYQSTHEDAKDDPSLEAKARAVVNQVFTSYTLKPEDFRFIAPPRAETVDAKQSAVSAPVHLGKTGPSAILEASRLYRQLTASSMLAYRTPWEFVAERFHCGEFFLRSLNDKLPPTPGIGAEFRVPNVIPFEIEKAFDEPLQPQVDPQKPVTAAVIGLSQLNIYRAGQLVAVMPMSPARPGLHGRGSWTILDVIPRPRLATFQEEWKGQTSRAAPLYGSSTPQPAATPFKPRLSSEQFLAAGPRNPAGVFWVNLAKSNSKDPLPYGLHGTSIPDEMNVLESIGGLRLTNWDIARAVRQLPPGTPLEWREH